MGWFGGSSKSATPWAPSTKEREKAAKREAREARQAANRRARHKAAVVHYGTAASIPFDSKRRGWFGRRS